mgnify:CR=1 FL=1
MDKNTSNRFKQLIGESIAEDRKPLLSSENVTDEKLADRLSESEVSIDEAKAISEAEEKEISEGWEDKSEDVTLNESEDTIYNLDFLNENEDK